MWHVAFLFTCIFCVLDISVGTQNSEDTLVLTHIVFRHGDRTPDSSMIFPSDPYRNETYFPYGLGQLTTDGKSRAYSLGVRLRKRYAKFLGDIYYEDLVESISSGYPRARMTLQSVHAGLFPPTDEYKLKKHLPWQPIAYSYSHNKQDTLLATTSSCRKVFKMLNDLDNSPKYRRRVYKYKNLHSYLTKYTGWNVTTSIQVFFIHNSLKTEAEWGFQLPDWTKGIYPEPLATAGENLWHIATHTLETRRVLIGNLLKKIVNDSVKKSKSTLQPEKRKLYLYSGHDMNIILLMGALGHFDVVVPYTGHLIFELHRIDDVYGFKIYFENYKNKQPNLITVKGCASFCPIEQFIELIEENLPDDDNWCPK